MLKKTKPVFPSRTTMSKRSVRGRSFRSRVGWRRLQRLGKSRGVFPDQLHRTRFGTAQDVIEDKDRKKGIGTTSKRSGPVSTVSFRSAAIEPIQIEIHRDVSRSRRSFFPACRFAFRVFRGLALQNFPNCCRKAEQREREITQCFPKHNPNPPIECRSRRHRPSTFGESPNIGV